MSNTYLVQKLLLIFFGCVNVLCVKDYILDNCVDEIGVWDLLRNQLKDSGEGYR